MKFFRKTKLNKSNNLIENIFNLEFIKGEVNELLILTFIFPPLQTKVINQTILNEFL